jgi:hypothetical protein
MLTDAQVTIELKELGLDVTGVVKTRRVRLSKAPSVMNLKALVKENSRIDQTGMVKNIKLSTKE